ncbi:unnamed protein product [Pedinophyceae sp. YPF-701]|nr:unnamed protein product [Pedinophyceae sp. YPF-701]
MLALTVAAGPHEASGASRPRSSIRPPPGRKLHARSPHLRGAQGPPTARATPEVADSAAPARPGPAWDSRTELLVGSDGIEALRSARVLLVGLGGVGSAVAEYLARAGVGTLTIVDGDVVDASNRNRQLPALVSTEGAAKVDVVAQRISDINPGVKLTAKQVFLGPDDDDGSPGDAEQLVAPGGSPAYDYVVDCIDSVAPKVALLAAGVRAGCTVVSAMGAGGRYDPARLHISDISQTWNDRFAKVVRKGLRRKGISTGVVCIFSDEPLDRSALEETAKTSRSFKRSFYGTISYMPAAVGLAASAYVIRHALGSPPQLEMGPDVPNRMPISRASRRERQRRQKAKRGQKSSDAQRASAALEVKSVEETGAGELLFSFSDATSAAVEELVSDARARRATPASAAGAGAAQEPASVGAGACSDVAATVARMRAVARAAVEARVVGGAVAPAGGDVLPLDGTGAAEPEAARASATQDAEGLMPEGVRSGLSGATTKPQQAGGRRSVVGVFVSGPAQKKDKKQS